MKNISFDINRDFIEIHDGVHSLATIEVDTADESVYVGIGLDDAVKFENIGDGIDYVIANVEGMTEQDGEKLDAEIYAMIG